MRILIVDDETGLRNSLNELLKDKFETFVCEDGQKAFEFLQKKSVDIVLSDYKMPNMDGFELLAKVQEIAPQTAFILMTAHGSIEGAIKAVKSGADDYISKPIEFTELLHRVDRIVDLKNWKMQKALKSGENKTRLIGSSPFLNQVKQFITQVAAVQSPVLVLGPSGTGKEVVAKSIHEQSPNKDQSFVAINCASLSENLIESELFGHEKGAFTGAVSSKIGKFELASGGTIFLDEIGELPLELQAKLLRVLQEKEFCRVGGTRQIKTTARVIAATHRDLKDWVKKGLFREDLYFRLNVLQLEMLPLSQRREDVIDLIPFYWQNLSEDLCVKAELLPAARAVLENYNYPGNVRELKNIIERLLVLAPASKRVDVLQLPKELQEPSTLKETNVHQLTPSAQQEPPGWKPGMKLEEYIDSIEEKIIATAFELSDYNQVQAAELLGINRGTLQYKIKKYDIQKKKAA